MTEPKITVICTVDGRGARLEFMHISKPAEGIAVGLHTDDGEITAMVMAREEWFALAEKVNAYLAANPEKEDVGSSS